MAIEMTDAQWVHYDLLQRHNMASKMQRTGPLEIDGGSYRRFCTLCHEMAPCKVVLEAREALAIEPGSVD